LSVDGVTIDTDGSGNLIIGNGGVNTTQLAANAATFFESDTSTGTEVFSDAYKVIREVVFTGTGVATELVANVSHGSLAAGSSIIISFNGSSVDGRVVGTGSQVMLLAGVTSVVGTNTVRLEFTEGPAPQTSTIYTSYLRALEYRR